MTRSDSLVLFVGILTITICNGYNGHMTKYREQEKLLPRLTSDDIKESTNMKMVFVTSSPVLTNEVKQYYASLKQ